MAAYERGIDLGEKTPGAYAGLGDTLWAMGRGEARDAKGKKLTAVAPKRGSVTYGPPSAAHLMARAKAVEAYRSALGLDPYFNPALTGLALVLASLQDYTPAVEAFTAANALKQHDDDGLFLAQYGSAVVKRLELDARAAAPAPLKLTSASAPPLPRGARPPALSSDLRAALWSQAKRVLER